MRKKLVLFLIIVLSLLISACSDSKTNSMKNILPLELKNVELIAITSRREGKNEIVYTKDKDRSKIKEFIKIYNQAESCDDSLGTTPGLTVKIKLSDGRVVIIDGGSQDFQTVTVGKKQFNIRGERLTKFFRSLQEQQMGALIQAGGCDPQPVIVFNLMRSWNNVAS